MALFSTTYGRLADFRGVDVFDQFLQERLYLKGVSPETLRYYNCVRQAFKPILADPTKAAIVSRIAAMKQGGLSSTSVNTYVRGLNAYLRWLHIEHGKELLKIPKLKEEQKVLTTLSSTDIDRLVKFNPFHNSTAGEKVGKQSNFGNLRRARLVALTILDTGLRASEVLGLTKEAVDLDNVVLRVMGKGGKQRLVP